MIQEAFQNTGMQFVFHEAWFVENTDNLIGHSAIFEIASRNVCSTLFDRK